MEYFYSFIYLFLVLKNIYYEKNIITYTFYTYGGFYQFHFLFLA